jgi:hypothetical protein
MHWAEMRLIVCHVVYAEVNYKRGLDAGMLGMYAACGRSADGIGLFNPTQKVTDLRY